MRTHAKLLLAGTVATIALAFAVGTASANHFSINNRTFRATWSPIAFRSGEMIRCNLTLEGSFHGAVIDKTLGTLIGYVTRAIRGTCESGTATILSETLPWHVTYEGFEGTLPTGISGIKLLVLGFSWRIQSGIINCLSRSEADHPFRGEINIVRELGGELKANTLSVEEGATIPCGISNGSFSGTGPITVLGGIERILVRLITNPLTASPSPVEFGRVATGSLTRREVTLTAGEEVTIESIRVRTGARYAITDPNRCAGTRLAAGGRCTFNVIFEAPAEAGTRVEDTVLIGNSLGQITDAASGTT